MYLCTAFIAQNTIEKYEGNYLLITYDIEKIKLPIYYKFTRCFAQKRCLMFWECMHVILLIELYFLAPEPILVLQ